MGDRLKEIQRALDGFHMDEARALARAQLEEEPSAAAYFLASQAALNHGQRVEYLHKALELDPDFQPAREELNDIAMPVPEAASDMAAPAPEEPSVPARADAESDKPKTKREEQAEAPEEADAAPDVKLAGLTKRFLALSVDAFIVGVATFAVMAVTDSFAPLYDAMYSADDLSVSAAFNQFQTETIAVNLLVSAVYNVAFLTLLNGQTLGKVLFKMRVVKKNGRRISILDALLRNVFGYTVSQIFLLGYLWAIFDEEQQAWHDKMAGTIVLDERNIE